LGYVIAVMPQQARPTAVVAAATTWQEFPGVWKGMLDEVWAVVNAAALGRGCRNVMLYRDDVPNVEVGVELLEPCPLGGRVVASMLPAGANLAGRGRRGGASVPPAQHGLHQGAGRPAQRLTVPGEQLVPGVEAARSRTTVADRSHDEHVPGELVTPSQSTAPRASASKRVSSSAWVNPSVVSTLRSGPNSSYGDSQLPVCAGALVTCSAPRGRA
jgi:hypothetical protein